MTSNAQRKRQPGQHWQRYMAEAKYDDSDYHRMTEKVKREVGYVYVIRMTGTPYYKIGKSQYPYSRSVGLANPPVFPPPIAAFDLVHLISTNWQSRLERELHNRFQNQRVGGEWFLLSAVDLLALRKMKHRDFPLMRQMKERVEELERDFHERMAHHNARARAKSSAAEVAGNFLSSLGGLFD